MVALAIPLLAFVVLLLTAVLVSRRDVFHPAVVLSAEYVVVAAFSVVYGVMTDAWPFFPNDAVTSSTLLVLLISASLVPSFLIKKPDLDLGLIRKHVGRRVFGIAAIAGTAGFICLLPVFIASLSIDAYASKSLGETASLVAGTPFVVVGSFFGAFSCVFGLLLFCDTRMELSRIVRTGLLLGFLNYGVVMECNKSRDSVVYYPLFFVLYLWLFRDKWRRKMKIFYYICLVCLVGVGAALFTVKTVQRFGGAGADVSVVDSTVGYLGQQVATFIEIADEDTPIEGHAEINFPVYFFLVNGEWVDASQLLLQRSKVIEMSFGTYVGTLFLAIGRWWTVAALLVLAVLAGAFFSRPTKRSPGTYVLGIMLYYQSLFQGAFYWMQGGRFGNGFIIMMVCMGIAIYYRAGWGLGVRGVGSKLPR